MKTKILISLFFLILLPLVSAYDTGNVAYITRTSSLYEHEMVNVLEDMGFNVNVVTESEFTNLNLDNYVFIIVGDAILQHPENIPVNDFPTMILNTWNINDFHWAKYGSSYTSSQPIIVVNNDNTSIITQGINDSPVVYTTAQGNGANLEVNYLSRFYKAPTLGSIVSTVKNNLDSVIATAVPGTKLKDGVTATQKGVFFGIIHSDEWTANGKKLFRNSVIWLLTDSTPPVISDINVTPAETSSFISWKTDDNSKTTFSYGLTEDLGMDISNSDFRQKHNVSLTNLNGKTIYYYKIRACNNDNFCSETGILNFSTLDLTPPVISNIQTKGLTDSSVNVTWETDEIANGTVHCGMSQDNLNIEDSETTFNLEHNVFVGSLDDNRDYYCKIHSCDASGNCVDSNVFSFKTTDVTPPNAVLDLRASVVSQNNIKLEWQAVVDDDIITYNIYSSDNISSFDFTTPTATTNDISWIDTNAIGYNQKYYIVRAEDESGNEEKNENIAGKFDIPISTGRNLISLPLIPFNKSIEKLTYQDTNFHPITKILQRKADGNYTPAVFDGSSWVYENGFDSLDNNKGYFVESNETYKWIITGTLPEQTQTFVLNPGVNLVGFTSLKTQTLKDAIQQLPPNVSVTEVFTRTGNECFEIARYYPNSNEWWSSDDFDELNPGKGYFFKVNKTFTWVYESR